MDAKVLSSGIRYTNLPEGYVRPESKRPNLSEVSECENVPVIDLACDDRSLIVQQVADACKNYGFFQVINHEVPLETVERVLEVAKEFFNLPVEEKLKLYSDDPSKTMRLSTSFNVNKEKVHNWRDDHRLDCDPLHNYVLAWPSDPPSFKTINDVLYSYLPDHTLDIPESGVMYSLVDKTVKRWGSVPIRGFDQMTITSKLKPYCSQVLLDMASRLIKKSQKLEILPVKHQPNVGSIIQETGGDDHLAFRCQPSGGEQSSSGGGEAHIIQGSLELASPELNNTPSASDQSVRASDLLENRDDDEQPPPGRSVSDMERGVAPPAGRRLDPSIVAQTCLFVSCEVCIAPLQIWYGDTSLSPNAKILLLFVELFGVAGFLLCFGAYWFQRKHKTSLMGCVATICGLLSILGTRFPEKAMIWLNAALWGLPLTASPFALKELI